MDAVLEVDRLSVTIAAPQASVTVLDDIGFSVAAGQSVGLVGESGSGKSLTALAIMGLLPASARARGRILWQGGDGRQHNLLALDERDYCKVRGRDIAMIFQEPLTALNPVKTITAQIAEGMRLQLGINRSEAAHRARRLLDRVGLPPARFAPDLYPHQLSGGQRQRVMIAMALACQPRLLIADEPTTALDVRVQAQILDLIQDIVDENAMGLLLITHDLGVIAQTVERVNVLYAGRIVERGDTLWLFEHMAHPYTRALFDAMPQTALLDTAAEAASTAAGSRVPARRLRAIPGTVPEPAAGRLARCVFADRCGYAQARCRQAAPPLQTLAAGCDHATACYFPLSWQ